MPRRRPADDAVIVRARAGDDSAWRELYDSCQARLVTWLRSQPHLDAAMSAEDLAHDAWFVAAGKIHDFSGSADDFAAWLFGIARHLSLNAARRSGRRNTTPAGGDPRELVPGQSGDDGIAAVDQLAWTRDLLSRLTAREAEVVACLDVIGLDVAATAAALDLTPTAVRVAHHRAVKHLRRIVEDSTTVEEPLSIFPG